MQTILPTASVNKDIFSVSDLNNHVRDLLTETFPRVWVSGEISNLAKPNSGHFYFSLKDEKSQIRAALFRNAARQLDFELENGCQVLVQAQVSLYPVRGDYQLIIHHIEPAGDGLLRRNFEKLKQTLQQAGLFAEHHKKMLPQFPETIGVITSKTGAALQDVLSVIKRRAPSVQVFVYHSAVQGDKAAKELVAALELANRHQHSDVLILCRGGGSLEDLWPFNEECVAQAIFNSQIPIVSGVGHEIDFTIADFVADRRAPTPSAAAELVSPHHEDLLTSLKQLAQQLWQTVHYQLQRYRHDLLLLSRALPKPQQLLRDAWQQLDTFDLRLQNAIDDHTHELNQQLIQLSLRLQHVNPLQKLRNNQQKLSQITHRLLQAWQHFLQHQQLKLQACTRHLHLISPLATLERGYAIARDEQQQIVKSTKKIVKGDKLSITLAKGKVYCQVETIEKKSELES